jgi:hypothetical protein
MPNCPCPPLTRPNREVRRGGRAPHQAKAPAGGASRAGDPTPSQRKSAPRASARGAPNRRTATRSVCDAGPDRDDQDQRNQVG